MKTNQIETKCNELASQVIPAAHLAGFLALDLESKLLGICTLAKIGGETKVYNAAWSTLKQLQSAA